MSGTLYGKITLIPLQDTGERSRSVVPDPNPGAGKPIWVPVIESVSDTSTGDAKRDLGWIETVFSDRIERVRTIRDKTAGEIELEDNQAIDDWLEQIGNDRSTAYTLRDLENRIRVLEGLPPLPLNSFKGLLKSRRR
jgi:hypothetical protein